MAAAEVTRLFGALTCIRDRVEARNPKARANGHASRSFRTAELTGASTVVGRILTAHADALIAISSPPLRRRTPSVTIDASGAATSSLCPTSPRRRADFPRSAPAAVTVHAGVPVPLLSRRKAKPTVLGTRAATLLARRAFVIL